MFYVLDTHSIIWFLDNDSRLGKNAAVVLDNPKAKLVVPTITLLEISSLYSKKRIKISVTTVYEELINKRKRNCKVYPLDEEVVTFAPNSLNIHDSIIVGTALVYRDVLKRKVALITKDGEITKSGIIQTIW